MTHGRLIALDGHQVRVSCSCARWSATVPARSGCMAAAAEKFRRHVVDFHGPTISPERTRPRDGEQEGSAVSPGAAEPSDHHKEGTPAVHAEVPVMSPRTGSEAR